MKDTLELPKEKRLIRYDFTAVEIHDLSLLIANKTKEQASLTEEKKSITSQYAAKLNEIKANLNKLSNQVSDGYESRETEFTIEYHKPTQGQKTLTPVNGGKAIEEKMLSYEYNLFNQVTDEEKDLLDEDVSEPIKKMRKGLRGKK